MSGYAELAVASSIAAASVVFLATSCAGNLALWVLAEPAFPTILRDDAQAAFWLRLSPFISGFLAALTTLTSFLLFEPRQTSERVPNYLALLAGLGLMFMLAMSVRILRELFLSLGLKSLLSRTAVSFSSPLSNCRPIYILESPSRLLAVVGIVRQRIFLGSDLPTFLQDEELRAAISHEMAHVMAYDNLKRLLLRATRFPGLLGRLADLDRLWASAAERAADREALRNGHSAMDLGSAIVRIVKVQAQDTIHSAHCGVFSALIDNLEASAIANRVEQLCSQLDNPVIDTSGHAPVWRLSARVALALYLCGLPLLLPLVHGWIERIVR